MTLLPERDAPPGRLDVGVIGHRDLGGADPHALRAIADTLFASLWGLATPAGSGGAMRPRCLSNAAQGADTLLSEAALRAGFDLVCLLPASRAVFARDFPPGAERAAFHALLAAAVRVEEPDVARTGPDVYLAAARRLLACSLVVVAVWDGRPEQGPGGTGQMVREACAAGRAVLAVDAAPPHTVTRVGTAPRHGLPAALVTWLAGVAPRAP